MGGSRDRPVGTMTQSSKMKNGASARGNNDINLFRRPAGLADGLALKEPAPRDAQIAGSPQLIGSPVPRNPSGGSASAGTVLGQSDGRNPGEVPILRIFAAVICAILPGR